MKNLFLFTLVLFLVACGPTAQNTAENTEAEEPSQEEPAEQAADYSEFDADAIERNTPSRALTLIEDVLSEGEAYISEDSWIKLLASAEKVQELFEKFNEEQDELYSEFEEKAQEAGQENPEKIEEIQEQLKKEIEEIKPSLDEIESLVKQAGFESLEQAREAASRSRKIDEAHKMLMSLETTLEASEIGKEVAKQPALAAQKKAGKEMSKLAEEIVPEQIKEIKETFSKYSFTHKDFEVFAKFKEDYDMFLLGIMQISNPDLE
jgi:hypothetical protein